MVHSAGLMIRGLTDSDCCYLQDVKGGIAAMGLLALNFIGQVHANVTWSRLFFDLAFIPDIPIHCNDFFTENRNCNSLGITCLERANTAQCLDEGAHLTTMQSRPNSKCEIPELTTELKYIPYVSKQGECHFGI